MRRVSVPVSILWCGLLCSLSCSSPLGGSLSSR